jgi:asparagine synthase (glutamine-hydrolysing)
MNTHAELDWDTPSNAQGAVVLHWDGRLDNRDDLLLLLRDRLREDTSNPAVACAAFERYGPEGFVRLIGDWSMVIRDRSNRAIVLASDFAGVRPLYYHVQPGRVLWSSRLQAIVDATGIAEMDEQYVRGFLLFGGCPNRTPYKGIYSVPPGHAVSVSSEATKVHRFWELPCDDEVRYRTERQYEEHLRTLFREAVSVRLQSKSPVVAELSGGLDSSSVVTMANHLMRSGAARATRLTNVSYVWRNSLDKPFIREIESFCGIEGVHISADEQPIITETQVGSASPEAFQPLRVCIAATARTLGAKTVLTGLNGDLMMGNWFDDSLQVAASLRHFRIGRACEEALAWSKILRRSVYSVLWRGFCAALPASLAPATIYAEPDGSYAPRSVETSLLPSFAGPAALHSQQSVFSDAWMQAPPDRRKYFRCLLVMLELRSLQPAEPLQHLEYTHPFAHRPLVEFLMAVPVDVLCRPGEPRRLMRSALSDLWPASLRARRSKGLFNAPWQEALRPLARVLLGAKQWHLVERGFVDRNNFRLRLQRLSAGLDCNQAQLRQIMLLELWLRNRADTRLSGQALRAARAKDFVY